MKVLDLEGLGYFWTKIKNKFYIKPDTGIPKSDLSSEVQGSLNKADTALQTETDPIFTASPAHGISSEDIVRWNNLESLGISTLSLSIDSSTYVLTLSGTKIDGTSFVVPNPIDLPLESVVVSGSYDSVNKKIILTLKDGSTIEFSIADLISGLQEEITPSNKLSADLIEDGVTNKVVTQSEKTTWNNKSDFSGSYNDLTDKPHIPNDQIQSDWNQSDSTQVDYIKNKPTNVSSFNNDAGYLTEHQSLSNYYTKSETDDLLDDKADISDLATVATTGSYNDLSNKPTIPTVNNSTITIQKNGSTVNSFTLNQSSNKTINITVPTTASDVSALPASTKYGASLSVSIDSTTYVITAQLKDQDGNNLGTAQTIDLPLESVVVSGSYDSATKKVVLTLKDGSTIDFSIADLVSGLQTEITSTNKLSADLIEDGTTNKVYTATEKTKLTGIANGAEVNVQSNWNETNTSSDAYILNKPTIPQVLDNPQGTETDAAPSVRYVENIRSEVDFRQHVDGTSIDVSADDDLYVKSLSADKLTNGTNNKVFTSAEQLKLTGIEIGAQVNVQSDWNETNVLSDAYILNKPTIPDITGKADKVSSAVEGNFASLDSNGNLEDSGYSYTDCLNELSDQYAPATESSELEPGDTFEEAFGKLEKTITDNEYVTAQALNDLNTNKQDTLESGTNIKTINGESILGGGDFNVTGDCIAYPSFEIDSNGHLIMSGGQQGLFTLENGHLMYNF